jgi:hypothetical protein
VKPSSSTRAAYESAYKDYLDLAKHFQRT